MSIDGDNEFQRFILHGVHSRRDGERSHLIRWVLIEHREQERRVGYLGGEPRGELCGGQDHRHAVVKLLHQGVGSCREDRTRLDPRPVRGLP